MRNKNQLKISFKAQLGRGVILQLEFNPLKIEWKRDYAYIIPEVPSPYKLELFIRDKFTYSQMASGIITYKVNLETKDILTALKGQEYKIEAFVADLMEKKYLSNQISLDEIL